MKTATVTKGSLRVTAREQLGRDTTNHTILMRRLALAIATREQTTVEAMPAERFGPIAEVIHLAQQVTEIDAIEIDISVDVMVDEKPAKKIVKAVADTWPFTFLIPPVERVYWRSTMARRTVRRAIWYCLRKPYPRPMKCLSQTC